MPLATYPEGVPLHEVVVVAYDGSELVDIASVTSTLDLANRLGADPAYRVVLASVAGGDVTCDSGLRIRAQARLSSPATRRHRDRLGRARAHGRHEQPALVRHLRRLADGATRVARCAPAPPCSPRQGCSPDGAPRPTGCMPASWPRGTRRSARGAAPIFIRDGTVATSGGVTSSLDLTLAFVEEDHGAELARWVAMGMVTYLQRPGNQAQMSMFTTAPRPDHVLVRQVLDHVMAQPAADHTTDALAAHVGVSVRHLTRLCRERLGEPPGSAVRRIRLEDRCTAADHDRPPRLAGRSRVGIQLRRDVAAGLRRQVRGEPAGLPADPGRCRARHLNGGCHQGSRPERASTRSKGGESLATWDCAPEQTGSPLQASKPETKSHRARAVESSQV